MYDSILQFATQLLFKPTIENGPLPERKGHTVFAGMGGSHLSAELLRFYDPRIPLFIHRDYGRPPLERAELEASLLIASSYSGNTEETLDFSTTLLREGLRPTVIASDGKLLALAKMERLPYIQIPNTIIQPRVAVGVSLKALALLVGRADLSRELERIALVLKPAEEEAEGKRIANELKGSLPLIYTSETNKSIAYNWKIKINETAKTPAFMNVFPELNHNEIAGFAKNQEGPKAPFKLVLIKDDRDHPRVQKRMEVTAQLLSGGGMKSVETSLKGTTPIERALRSLIVADWAAYHLALVYQVNPDNNPAVEEFKKRMA